MKTTFRANWGWSTLSEWGSGDRFPNAVKLEDGAIISLDEQDILAAQWEAAQRYPRSRATYTRMDADGIVRVRFADGGSSPGGRSGDRWARMEIIAPKTAIWLYGGRCPDCGGEVEYAEDAEAQSLCDECIAMYEWQMEQSGFQAEQMAEARQERDAWIAAA